MIYYALGVLEDYGCLFEIERVVIRVHQPRLDNWDEWESTPAELMELGNFHKSRLAGALVPGAPYTPSEKACKFCKAKSTCKARAEHLRRIAIGHFEDLDADITTFDTQWPETMPDPERMDADEIAAVWSHTKMVLDFLNAVKVRALHMLLHDEPVGELKVVEGVSRRRYIDGSAERAAAAHLVSHGVSPAKVFKLKTVSPAEAERLLPKPLRHELTAYVVKPPGKPTVAHLSDRRPVFTLTAGFQFEDLDEEADDESLE